MMPRLTMLLLLTVCASAAQTHTSGSPAAEKTFFVECSQPPRAERVLSPISIAENGEWRAYIEVNVHDGCLHTTQLLVSGPAQPWRMVYFMPPTREDDGNGMQLLGWAPRSRILLAKTQMWQNGTDGGAREGVLAIDARTALVYEPNLGGVLEARKNQQCGYRVTDAGFAANPNVEILVRVRLFTYVEEGTELSEVPVDKRCTEGDETWSFNYATGEVKKMDNSQPLLLFKKFAANPRK